MSRGSSPESPVADTDHAAIIAMAFGAAAVILSGFVPIGFVPGIIAVVTARRSMARIAASEGALAGRGIDLVAQAFGIFGSIVSVIFLVILVVRAA